MKKLMIGGALMAVVAAGCVTDWKRPTNAPVREFAAIDKMTGDELTVKRTFA